MRREDKNRVPPRLKVHLPAGYHLEAVPGGYNLFFSYSVGLGRMTEIAATFPSGSTVQEIEAAARALRCN